MSALLKAISICGSQAALARAIGGRVKQQHVWWWVHRCHGLVPADHCRAIERATGARVTRYQLRRDVFGPAPRPSKRA